MNEQIITDLDDSIRKRMVKRIPSELLDMLSITEVYLAGNCCNSEKPNDIDLFPVTKGAFSGLLAKLEKLPKDVVSVKCKTKNATTVLFKENIIQFCNFYHESIEALVESFDFSHIKIGVKVSKEKNNFFEVYTVYYSQDWLTAKLTGSTVFTKTEYPLSSLIRTFKYAKRGDFVGRSFISSVIKILISMIERGYDSYDDFKNQLDAVDLGLIPEEYGEDSQNIFIDLFNLLKKGE